MQRVGPDFILSPESHAIGAGRDLRENLVPRLLLYIAGEE